MHMINATGLEFDQCIG